MSLRLRPLSPADAALTQPIFLEAVAGTSAYYDAAQRQAWAGGLSDPNVWARRVGPQTGVLALWGDVPAGFMTLGKADYLDMAYVRPEAAGQGVGRALHDAMLRTARTQGAEHLATHASLAARGFFTRLGWTCLEEEQVPRGTVTLRRFKMQRAV